MCVREKERSIEIESERDCDESLSRHKNANRWEWGRELARTGEKRGEDWSETQLVGRGNKFNQNERIIVTVTWI